MYLYRVDSLEGLRAIRDHHFRPVRWDKGSPTDRAPHAAFQALLPTLGAGQGIFRICFWATESAARKDYSFRSTEGAPCGLLRIRKKELERHLPGWTEGEDDLIGPQARMYWRTERLAGPGNFYAPAGIPVKHFQHWVRGRGWVDFHHSPALLPESSRLAAQAGMVPIFYHGQGGALCQAYWKPVLLCSPGRERNLVVALRPASLPGPVLQNDPGALQEVASQLLSGPLSKVETRRIRFAILCPDGPRLYHYVFRPEITTTRTNSGWFGRALEWIGASKPRIETSLTLKDTDDLKLDELTTVCRESGLPTHP